MDRQTIQSLHNGLAYYVAGEGTAALLMPYPHGFGGLPIVYSPLASVLRSVGMRTISFDPPGAFGSTRPARMDMPEMLSCAQETLECANMRGPLTVVGHSMGGLCAIAYALSHPERVKQLILICTLSGGPAIQRYKGMPWGAWLRGWERVQYAYWGFRLGWGLAGNLALHKRMQRMILKTSFYDKSHVAEISIERDDAQRPAPVRDTWPRTVFMHRLDYRTQLGAIRAPALVCGGRHDPQAPLGCSAELAQNIPGAQLVVFEQSGHYPYIEEEDKFKLALRHFLVANET